MLGTSRRVQALTDEVERLKSRLGNLDDAVDRLFRLHIDPLYKVPGISLRFCPLSHEMPNGFSVTDNLRAWDEYMGVKLVKVPEAAAKLVVQPKAAK